MIFCNKFENDGLELRVDGSRGRAEPCSARAPRPHRPHDGMVGPVIEYLA